MKDATFKFYPSGNLNFDKYAPTDGTAFEQLIDNIGKKLIDIRKQLINESLLNRYGNSNVSDLYQYLTVQDVARAEHYYINDELLIIFYPLTEECIQISDNVITVNIQYKQFNN